MLKKLLHKDKKTRKGFKKSEIYSLLNKSFKKTSNIYNVYQPEIFLFKNNGFFRIFFSYVVGLQT